MSNITTASNTRTVVCVVCAKEFTYAVTGPGKPRTKCDDCRTVRTNSAPVTRAKLTPEIERPALDAWLAANGLTPDMLANPIIGADILKRWHKSEEYRATLDAVKADAIRAAAAEKAAKFAAAFELEHAAEFVAALSPEQVKALTKALTPAK